MDEAMILDVFTESIRTILMLSAPMLLVGLAVGLIIAVFQATTQIQEQTLAFVPKILAVFLTLLLTTSWMFSELIDFTMRLFNLIDQLVL